MGHQTTTLVENKAKPTQATLAIGIGRELKWFFKYTKP